MKPKSFDVQLSINGNTLDFEGTYHVNGNGDAIVHVTEVEKVTNGMESEHNLLSHPVTFTGVKAAGLVNLVSTHSVTDHDHDHNHS